MLDVIEFPEGLVIRTEAARIDAVGAIAFRDRMKALTEGRKGRVVLDLASVDFIDSSGLGAIVGALRQLPEGCRLELAGLSPEVRRVFRLTRMDTVFTIHDDAAAAGLSLAEPT